MTTFIAHINAAIEKVAATLKAKAPTGTQNDAVNAVMAEALMWDEIARLANNKSKDAWQALESVTHTIDQDTPGERIALDGANFAVTLKVSNPVKSFDAEALAVEMHRRFKVSVITAKEMIEAAKLPKNVKRTWRVVEK